MGRTATLPRSSPVVDEDGLITFEWDTWLDRTLAVRLSNTPHQIVAKRLTEQAAAIGTTPLGIGTTAEGLFRVSYIIRQTVVATTASLQVTIGWTRGLQSMTEVGAALTSNLLTTHETRTYLIRRDGASAITYAVAYSSTGTPAQYEIDVIVEQL